MPERPPLPYTQLSPVMQEKLDRAVSDAARAVLLIEERRPRFESAIASVDAMKSAHAALVVEVASLKSRIDDLASTIRGTTSQGLAGLAKDPVVLFVLVVVLGALGINPVEMLK